MKIKLFVLFTLLTFFSCQKDLNDIIVGKWVLDSSFYKKKDTIYFNNIYSEVFNGDSIIIKNNTIENKYKFTEKIIFYADGSYKSEKIYNELDSVFNINYWFFSQSTASLNQLYITDNLCNTKYSVEQINNKTLIIENYDTVNLINSKYFVYSYKIYLKEK